MPRDTSGQDTLSYLAPLRIGSEFRRYRDTADSVLPATQDYLASPVLPYLGCSPRGPPASVAIPSSAVLTFRIMPVDSGLPAFVTTAPKQEPQPQDHHPYDPEPAQYSGCSTRGRLYQSSGRLIHKPRHTPGDSESGVAELHEPQPID